MAVRAVVRAPSNIALIKYWGKADEDLILPLNSSLSLTTDIDQVYTQTTIDSSESIQGIQLILNNSPCEPTKRMLRVIGEVRKLLPEAQREWGIRIDTINNFPTAAGMASSAAGFAALTIGLVKAFGVEERFPGQFSAIARLGSGSASRSLYGGFVQWHAGATHESSIVVQLHPQSHWPDLELILVLISTASKEVSSTTGMKNSAENSRELRERITRRVPERMERLKEAIETKDFRTLAEVTMADSDDLHHVCETSEPPIAYLTYKSHAVKDVVRALNTHTPIAAYTFDAGPNAFIVTERRNRVTVLEALLSLFRLASYAVGLNLQAQDSVPESRFLVLQTTAEVPVCGIWSLKVSDRGPYLLD